MAFGLQLLTPPAVEPIDLTAARLHLRQDFTDDVSAIAGYLSAARRAVEEATGRQLVAATWRLSLLSGPNGVIKLPRAAPLISLGAVTYTHLDTGIVTALTVDDYRADASQEPARLWPPYDVTPPWPDVRAGPGSFVVTYTAGYAARVTAVAASDLLTITGRTVTDGEAVVLSNSGGALPAPLAAATTYYVRDVSGQTFKLAATAGGAAIDITDAGTGVSFVGAVPEPLIEATLLLLGDLYERREMTTEGAAPQVMRAFDWMISPFRVDRYA